MQRFSSIEQIQLVLRVKKQSDTGLFKNQRLLAIKSGFISYYSHIPKQFVGNTRSLQLIGQLPKYTFSAQYVTKITYKFPILDIQFLKDKLIDKDSFKKIIETNLQTENINELQKEQKQNTNKTYWRFKSKQIDLTNAFVEQVKTCMKPQEQQIQSQEKNKNQVQYRRLSLQPSLKIMSDAFKVAKDERKDKQVSEIINERSSMYFTSSQIENQLKKRTTDLNLKFNKYSQQYKNENRKKKVTKQSQRNSITNMVGEIKAIQVPQPYQQKQIQLKKQNDVNKKEQEQKVDEEQIEIKEIINKQKSINKQNEIFQVKNDLQMKQQMKIQQDIKQKIKQCNVIVNDDERILLETCNNSKDLLEQKQKQIINQINNYIQQKQNDIKDNSQDNNTEMVININKEQIKQDKLKQLEDQTVIVQEHNQQQNLFVQNQKNQLIRQKEQDEQVHINTEQQIVSDRIELITTIQQSDTNQYYTLLDSSQYTELKNKVKDKSQQQNQTNQITNHQQKPINKLTEKEEQVDIKLNNQIILIKKQQQNQQQHYQQLTKVTNYIKQQQQQLVNYKKQQRLIRFKQKLDKLRRIKITQQFISNIQLSLSLSKQNKTISLLKPLEKSQKQYFEAVKEITITFNQLMNQHKQQYNHLLQKQYNQLQQQQLNYQLKNRRQKWIMCTDFINYPSLLSNQQSHQLTQQNQVNTLAFNHKYKSKLHDRFLKYKRLYKLIEQKYNNNNDNTQYFNYQKQQRVQFRQIYYLRYKQYEGLVMQINVLNDDKQILISEDDKQTLISECNNNKSIKRYKDSFIKYNKQCKNDQYFYEEMINILSLSNIIESYQSVSMIRNLCIQQTCLYLNTNQFYINRNQLKMTSSSNNSIEDNQSSIKYIFKSISQRKQLQQLRQQQGKQEETINIVNKLIYLFLYELLGIYIKGQKHFNQNKNQTQQQQDEEYNKEQDLVVSIKQISLNNNNNKKQLQSQSSKYIVKLIQNNTPLLLDLTQNQLKYQQSSFIYESTESTLYNSKNSVNLYHKQNKQIHNNNNNFSQSFTNPNQSQSYDTSIVTCYYQKLSKHTLLFMKNSSILKLLNQQHSSQIPSSMYYNIITNPSVKLINQFSITISMLLQKFNHIQNNYKQTQHYLSQKLSLILNQINSYLSQKRILYSIHFIKLKFIIALYESQRVKHQNIKDLQFIQQQIESQFISFISLIKQCIKKLTTIKKSVIQNKNKHIQAYSIIKLQRITTFIGFIVTYFFQLISKIYQYPINCQKLTKTIKQQKSVQESLQLIQTLYSIINYFRKTNQNKSKSSQSKNKSKKSQLKLSYYTHPIKYRLQIMNLTFNTNQILLNQRTLKTIIQLLSLTIDKKDQPYFFKALDLLITYWKLGHINDNLLIQTFLSISQSYLQKNTQFQRKIINFLDHQIKTQDKIKFFLNYPLLKTFYHL